MAHGGGVDTTKAVQIALAAEGALLGLDAQRSTLYSDMLFSALSEAARRALRAMNLPKYEYRTEFAKRYYGAGMAEGKAEGIAEGRAEGRAEFAIRLLTRRFGELPGSIRDRIHGASIDELDRIGDRLLTADSLTEALGLPQSAR